MGVTPRSIPSLASALVSGESPGTGVTDAADGSSHDSPLEGMTPASHASTGVSSVDGDGEDAIFIIHMVAQTKALRDGAEAEATMQCRTLQVLSIHNDRLGARVLLVEACDHPDQRFFVKLRTGADAAHLRAYVISIRLLSQVRIRLC